MNLRRSPEWIQKQLLTIGGSAAGVVAGESPYQTPAELYDVMVAADSGFATEKLLNDDMRRGILTEPLHRQLLEDELKIKVHEHDQDTFLHNEQYPWAHALPDGWLYLTTGEDSAETIPVQLKCPRPRAWHEIKLKGIHGHWWLGSQHVLALTGAPYEHFSVLNVETMRLIHFPVYRDDAAIEHLMRIEKTFYESFQARQRPPETPSERIEMPVFAGELLKLEDEEALDAASTLIEAREITREAQALEEAAKKKIQALMGDARVAELPGLRAYNLLHDGRVTLDKPMMLADGIDVGKYEKRGKPYREFRTYRLGK